MINIAGIQETSPSGMALQFGIAFGVGAVTLTALFCAIRCYIRRNRERAAFPLANREIIPQGENSAVQRAASRHFQSLTESKQ